MKKKNDLLPSLLNLVYEMLENEYIELSDDLNIYHLNPVELNFIHNAGKLNELKNKRNKEVNELMRKIEIVEKAILNIGRILTWKKKLN